MVAPHPDTDPRTASQLYGELKRLAEAMVPEWKGAGVDGEFGDALLRIASRMGAHVTQRIAKTPRKDSVEFYNMLDIPADAPVPAEVPLVFVLNDKTEDPVFAAAGVQVSASTEDGDAVFETDRDVRLTPARLNFVASADGENDRIDRAPGSTLALEKAETLSLDFDIVSFSGKGSRTLQLEPIEGLAKGDYLQIGGVIYQLDPAKDPTDGLVDITEDLTENVGPTDSGGEWLHARKVEFLKAFELPNLQQHDFYIGHNELFNLVNPAVVTVVIGPETVRDNLLTDIEWQFWGTQEGKSEPGWHNVVASPGGAGAITLTKSWIGTVDPMEIAVQSCRWLRAHHTSKIAAKKVPGTRISTVQISVATLDGSDPTADSEDSTPTDCAEFNSTQPKKSPVDSDDIAADGEAKKALSITQAFHNGTPLPLTTRFFPFGPEPQRFDTFSIAAPEALSKKNADVTLDVKMPDASISNVTIAKMEAGALRAYGIGKNGRLQQVVFEGDQVMWREIRSPQPEDLDDETQLGQLQLDPEVSPQAVELRSTAVQQGNFTIDLIVARDKSKRSWAIAVKTQIVGSLDLEFGSWKALTEMPTKTFGQDLVLLRREELPPTKESRSTLVAIGDEDLYRTTITTKLTTLGISTRRWFKYGALPPSAPPPAPEAPSFDDTARIVPVLENDWPKSVLLDDHEVVVLDKNAKVFFAKINRLSSTITWEKIFDDATEKIVGTVRPVAARMRNNDLIAYFARQKSDDDDALKPLALSGSVASIGDSKPEASDFEILNNTSFRCYPSGYGTEPLTVATGVQESTQAPNRVPAIAVWPGIEPADIIFDLPDLPDETSERTTIIIAKNDVPAILVSGKSETVYVQQLAEFANFELYNAVEISDIPTGGGERYYIEDGTPGGSVPPPIILLPDVPLFVNGAAKIFALPVTTMLGTTAISGPRDWNVWETNSAELAGSRNTTQINHLKFDNTLPPAIGDTVAIQNVRYTVEPPTDPTTLLPDHVQVNSALPSGGLTYVFLKPLPLTPGFTAKTLRTASIIRLFDLADATEKPKAVAFRSSSIQPDPARQGLSSVIEENGAYWAILGDAWTSVPDNMAEVVIVGVSGNGWDAHEFERGYQNPELAWEYFDGESWRRLRINSDTTFKFAKSGAIEFTVPENLSQGEVAGQEDYWIRARLVGGDYGSVQYIVKHEPPGPNPTTQKIEVDRSGLQPPEVLSVDVSFSFKEAIDPEFVYTYNNLTYRNQTQASASPEASFEIFEGVRAINENSTQRVIYFGLSKPFSGGPLSIFVDADDQEFETPLVFEVRGEREWIRVSAADETAGFHRRGYIDIGVDTIAKKTRYFNEELYWLRARPATTDAAWSPLIRGFHINAVRSTQAKSLKQEIVGSSNGEPEQKFLLAEYPVIPNSLELRVRENLTEEERAALNRDTEGLKKQQQAVAQYDDELSIDGDWVLWKRVDTFQAENEDSRVYKLDSEKGEIAFGSRTRTPPAGANGIRAIAYKSGGGEKGNLDSFQIKSPKSSIRGLEIVANPVPSSGGTDTPSLDDQLSMAPHRLRHANLALAAPDIEALATATSPNVVRARCLSPQRPGDPIRVAIAVRTGDRCPQPSIAYREGVARRILVAAWGALSDRDLRVEVPDYAKVRVKATLRATSVQLAARLEERATAALKLLLHPVARGGGPRGDGWPFGRTLFETDILRTVSVIEGFDRVERIDIAAADGGPLPSELSPTALIAANNDDIQVEIVLAEEEV